MTKPQFDVRREKPLNEASFAQGPILYVMAREQRVEDNWALIAAATKAAERQVPLLVLFALAPMFNNGSVRHNEWMLGGLRDVAAALAAKSIPFFIR